MKKDLKEKFEELKSKKHFKLIAALTLIFVLIIGFSGIKALLGSGKSLNQNTAVVKKGNINMTVTGSGTVCSTNETKLYSQVSAKITKINYKEGDVIKAGDVIAEFDDADIKTSVANSVNGLEQSQISAQSSYDDYNNLRIKAPFSGQVSKIIVTEGSTVQKGGAILTISDTSKLKVLLTYNAKDAENIAAGQSADVYLTSLMEAVSGTVTYVSNQPATTASGGLIYTVEIRLNNPGAVTEGTTASADINTNAGTVTSTNTAPLAYVNKQTVNSLTGGTVQSISVKENQNVSSGAIMITIKNDDVRRARDIAGLKIAASENQVSSSLNQSSKYKITAPYDGTILKIGYKEGDTVSPGAEVAIVSNPDAMQFDVAVDELDIATIAMGQKVNITVDAIQETFETPMRGEVIKIALTGNTANGVTTYPVTIKFDGDISKLKSKMNANAEIMVNTMNDVVYVPAEAVSTSENKSYVWVKENGKSKSGSAEGYYANSVRKEIEAGEKTHKYIVIESGIQEGDVVILPQNKTSAADKAN